MFTNPMMRNLAKNAVQFRQYVEIPTIMKMFYLERSVELFQLPMITNCPAFYPSRYWFLLAIQFLSFSSIQIGNEITPIKRGVKFLHVSRICSFKYVEFFILNHSSDGKYNFIF